MAHGERRMLALVLPIPSISRLGARAAVAALTRQRPDPVAAERQRN